MSAEFDDELYRQFTSEDDRTIVDSLRPMFPQFGEAVFRECIANARRMFPGAYPNTILTEAINFLLAGTFHEAPQGQNNARDMYHETRIEQNNMPDLYYEARNTEQNNTQHHDTNEVIVLNSEQAGDVVYLRTSNKSRTNGSRPIFLDDSEPFFSATNHVSTSGSDCVEITPPPTTPARCRPIVHTTTLTTSDMNTPDVNLGAVSHEEAQPAVNSAATTVPMIVVNEPDIELGAVSHEEVQPAANSAATPVPMIVVNGPDIDLGAVSHEEAQLAVNSGATTVPMIVVNGPDVDLGAVSHEEVQPVDPAEEAFKELRGMFTTVQEAYLRNLIQQWSGSPYTVLVNSVCNHLLENNNYPKKETVLCKPTTSREEKSHDYFTNYSTPVTQQYVRQCFQLLDHDFRMVKMLDIRKLLKRFNWHYAPCKKALEEGLENTLKQMQQVAYSMSSSYVRPPSSTSVTQEVKPKGLPKGPPKGPPPVTLHLLKCGRSPRRLPTELVPELQNEVDFVKKLKLACTAEQDRAVALMLNEEQYEEEGQLIECGCCYGEATFDQMVQCMEGHLFCGECLNGYAKEAAFGEGKAQLTCMTDGCSSTFPVSQLKRCLPTNILTKYEDRVQEESLSLAQMEDLVKCPACDYAAIMPPGDKVFKCQDPLCAKEICRYCKEDWSEHFGLPCSEVEKGNEKKLRLSYEERMTMAKIRKCAKCGCEFTKSTGCNKMTCRCGTTQCYVCRKSSIQYIHFCSHPREPGENCAKCVRCSLWSDPSEDDDRAVKELEAEAVEAKRKLETNAPENAPKKARVN